MNCPVGDYMFQVTRETLEQGEICVKYVQS